MKKLVRSKMRKMIEAEGYHKVIDVTPEMFDDLFIAKIEEEMNELIETIKEKNKEAMADELVDVLTLVINVCELNEIDYTSIISKYQKKKKKRGDFISDIAILM